MAIDRRAFLKWSGMALVAVPLADRIFGAHGSALAADADLPMAKDLEEPAKSLKFCPNADKPTAGCSGRKEAARKSQYCYSCQLFTKLEGDAKASKGKCMIMPKNRVPGSGWCNSWVQNPTVKS